MFGLKRPRFKSKKDAFRTFFSYFSAPWFIVILGIAGVGKTRRADLVSYEQAKLSIFFIIIAALLSLPFWWYKAFWAVSAIMNDECSGEPETVICLSCQMPFLFTKVKNIQYPKCNGVLENLEGFYERHPELMKEGPKK
jgi:hypothetical protein